MPISPIITTAGLTAVLNASNDGLSARITHVALGDAAWTPDNSAAALQNERRRVTVSNGERIQPTQIHITAVENGSTEYWIRELGFYLDDGTLLAIWSDPEQPLAYKAAGVDVLLAFDLVLSALPDDSVEVVGTGGVSLPPSTEVVEGVLRFATDAEATAADRRDVGMSPVTTRILGDSRYSRPGHRHSFSSLTGRPSSYPPRAHDHAWSEITGRPSEFPPGTHRHPWEEITGRPSQFPPADHSHSEYVARSQFVVTSGRMATENRHSQTRWAGYNDWTRNYALISPPPGFRISHIRGFIASPAVINFNGDVNGDDFLWCRWRYEFTDNRIRVICANSENRPDTNGVGSHINYLAVWVR